MREFGFLDKQVALLYEKPIFSIGLFSLGSRYRKRCSNLLDFPDHTEFMVLEFGICCKFGGRGLGRRTSARVSRTGTPSPSEGVPLFDKEG